MSKGGAQTRSRIRFKPYPAYKDSGIEWLGKIPKHWDAKRMKFVAPARISKLDAKPDDTIYIGLDESWKATPFAGQPAGDCRQRCRLLFPGRRVLFGKLRPYLERRHAHILTVSARARSSRFGRLRNASRAT